MSVIPLETTDIVSHHIPSEDIMDFPKVYWPEVEHRDVWLWTPWVGIPALPFTFRWSIIDLRKNSPV